MNDKLNDDSPRFTNLKCVVCNSFGTVTHKRIKCHGCNGRGFVIIDNRTGLVVDEWSNRLPVIERKIDKNEN